MSTTAIFEEEKKTNMLQINAIALTPSACRLGTLRSKDADDNENVEKTAGFRGVASGGSWGARDPPPPPPWQVFYEQTTYNIQVAKTL